MNRIGVMVDSFRLGVLEGIDAAAKVGAGAVQIYVGHRGDVGNVWTPAFRAQVRQRLQDAGLVISAMCGDLGGHGFQLPEELPWRIEETEKMLELTRELGGDVLTTHIGVVPEDTRHPRRQILLDAIGTLAKRAESAGCRLAIETGPERPEILKLFLDDVGSKFVGVNYDPANLQMVLLGVDPIKGVKTLRDYIFHAHAKDGKMIRYAGPDTIYKFFAEGGIEDMRMEEYMLETPLGEGDVDMAAWLGALSDIGYQGYVTIEREVGDDPAGDIAKAVQFLKSHLT